MLLRSVWLLVRPSARLTAARAASLAAGDPLPVLVSPSASAAALLVLTACDLPLGALLNGDAALLTGPAPDGPAPPSDLAVFLAPSPPELRGRPGSPCCLVSAAALARDGPAELWWAWGEGWSAAVLRLEGPAPVSVGWCVPVLVLGPCLSGVLQPRCRFLPASSTTCKHTDKSHTLCHAGAQHSQDSHGCM